MAINKKIQNRIEGCARREQVTEADSQSCRPFGGFGEARGQGTPGKGQHLRQAEWKGLADN